MLTYKEFLKIKKPLCQSGQTFKLCSLPKKKAEGKYAHERAQHYYSLRKYKWKACTTAVYPLKSKI